MLQELEQTIKEMFVRYMKAYKEEMDVELLIDHSFFSFLVYVFFGWILFWRRHDMLVQVEKSKVYSHGS